MKARWIVLLGLLTVVLVAAVPLTLPRNKAGRVQYVEVTQVPGVPPTELMKRARLWLAQRAHTAADVTVGEEPHCIMAGDSFQVPRQGMPITVFYTLAFEAQGNALCSTVGAFSVFDGSVRRPLEYYLKADGTARMNAWLVESVDQQARGLLADLHQALGTSPAAAKK
ncbi:MAG: hypothetical protein WBS54_08300 [Acidobacteriota bacterium]